jgi:phosphoribosylformylglycinamidine synthase
LLRNRGLRFLGRDVHIAAERLDTPFTHALAAAGAPLRMPIAHGEGCYFGDEAALQALERERGVLFRYVDAAGQRAADDDRAANPNGSLRAIAGVVNDRGNVAGLMPHPERAAEAVLGSDDGAGIVRSLVESAARAAAGERPVAVGA